MSHNIVLIKYGGAAMHDKALVQEMMCNVVRIQKMGMHPVIVHGGGKEISKMCEKVGITPVFVDGLRITDQQTLEIAQMVLIGKTNKELVCALHQAGGDAVGISGHDASLFYAKAKKQQLGFVGEIENVNPSLIITLVNAGYIPVIAPIATSAQAQSYNVNADSAASHIAIALRAQHFVLLTDTCGIRKNIQDPQSHIDGLSCIEALDLIRSGIIQGGMIPKVEAAVGAIRAGVARVHIVDGSIAANILCPFETMQAKVGTTIYA